LVGVKNCLSSQTPRQSASQAGLGPDIHPGNF